MRGIGWAGYLAGFLLGTVAWHLTPLRAWLVERGRSAARWWAR